MPVTVAPPELPDDTEAAADIFLSENVEGDLRLNGWFLELIGEIWDRGLPGTVEKDAMDGDSIIPMEPAAEDSSFWLCRGAVHICIRQRLWRREPPRNLDTWEVARTLGLRTRCQCVVSVQSS